MQDDLVGFLVGALDAEEHADIKRKLELDAELQKQLAEVEKKLAPLALAETPVTPPEGLTNRTLSFVFDHVNAAGVEGHVEAKNRVNSPAYYERLASESSEWSFSDFVVAAGICLAAACLFFPALINGRYQSHLTHCQNNMRQIGVALNDYSMNHGRGYLPTIPASGNMAAAGSYAVMLQDKGLIQDRQVFNCPSRGKQILVKISGHELNEAQGSRLITLQQQMGGDYAYTLGYLDRNGKLKGIKNQSRPRYVVLADAPLGNAARGDFSVHGRGQNVLFEDGHAAFLATRLRPGSEGDDFFVNDQGMVEAGMHENDSVLAPSATPPIVFIKAAH